MNEKKEIKDERKHEEKRKDLMMEVERLKKIKFYEEQERKKKEESKLGHLKIID